MNARPRLVALVGPTGAGKTDFAVGLARHFDAEIISADSRQVYRRLDIGSAKPTAQQRAAVAHHVVDVVDPNETFDCASFRRLALEAIADITHRGKRVLIVGGTGLYIKVLLHGLFDAPSRNPAIRARLLRAEEEMPGILHQRLRTVDPQSAARLHPHDHIRLIRALEVFELTGRPISFWHAQHHFSNGRFDARVFGLSLPRNELYARINARCQAMINQGLVDEVRQLYADGYDPELPALRSPGYREIGDHLRGCCDLPTAVAHMARATRRLAKRQLTWFRADSQIVWCAPDIDQLYLQMAAFWETTA